MTVLYSDKGHMNVDALITEKLFRTSRWKAVTIAGNPRGGKQYPHVGSF